MKYIKILIMSFFILLFCAGCATKYASHRSYGTVYFANKGDTVIRKMIKPNEIILDYDGTIIPIEEYDR